MATLALARPFLYLTNRVFATRLLHTVLRGVSRDRLDLLGEEFFEYFLKPRLKQEGVAKLQEAISAGGEIVLVSQGLDHVVRPLAEAFRHRPYNFQSSRFPRRHRHGTPARPRNPPSRRLCPLHRQPTGRPRPPRKLNQRSRLEKSPEILDEAIRPAERTAPKVYVPVVHYEARNGHAGFSVRAALRGKNILLIGATGFIGKVWLANLLTDLPEIGRIFLLVRHNRANTSLERLQRVFEESPVFEKLAERYGDKFARFLQDRIEVVDGDVSKPNLGLCPQDQQKLTRSLDVIVNSSGLTDFNPGSARRTRRECPLHSVRSRFSKGMCHASLLHLSTCYVVGQRDGRVLEELPKNYSPRGIPDYDAVNRMAIARKSDQRTEPAPIRRGHYRTSQRRAKKEHAARICRARR